jgi:hypothetical protein
MKTTAPWNQYQIAKVGVIPLPMVAARKGLQSRDHRERYDANFCNLVLAHFLAHSLISRLSLERRLLN